jgi:murein DD-endopeptidase MepM/ murein hydrolase activator NlpD
LTTVSGRNKRAATKSRILGRSCGVWGQTLQQHNGGAGNVYQPATRAFDGVDYFSVPPAAPVSARPLSRTFRLADLDLVVDLGADIGSARWWQGLGTLGFLSAMAITLALRPAPFTEPAQPALGAAGIEQLASVSLTPLATTAAVPAYSPSARVMALVEPPERPRIEVTARLREVDSFNGALRRAGVSLADTANVAILVAAHTDVRSLKPGTTFDIVLGRRSDKTQPRPLESLSFRAAFDLALEVTRTEAGDLVVTRDEIAVDDTPLRVTGDVGNSLYKSARAMGLPSRIVAKFIKALSAKVNFQRDVGSSDNFDLIVEHRRAETGETETGDLLYARLDGRKDVELLRWTYNGAAKFFLPDGSSAIEGMIGSPIAGARLSSGFGMRFHPILRRTRMHAGVDYSAGYGTPVLSTAPGRVVFAGRNGGYGNQVRVAHNNGIITTYSHLSKIAANVGERVAAGERIGNVGSTGLSTGPHLHYEVLVGGRNVNPRSTKLPLQEKLSGSELARFKAELERMRQLKPLATSHDA